MAKLGDKRSIPCLNLSCTGYLVGRYGGKFWVGGANYTQVRNCKCDSCEMEIVEAFEIWNGEEYWVSVHQRVDRGCPKERRLKADLHLFTHLDKDA